LSQLERLSACPSTSSFDTNLVTNSAFGNQSVPAPVDFRDQLVDQLSVGVTRYIRAELLSASAMVAEFAACTHTASRSAPTGCVGQCVPEELQSGTNVVLVRRH
jgi:hypothetical protein